MPHLPTSGYRSLILLHKSSFEYMANLFNFQVRKAIQNLLFKISATVHPYIAKTLHWFPIIDLQRFLYPLLQKAFGGDFMQSSISATSRVKTPFS
jgi:hypothetical protein